MKLLIKNTKIIPTGGATPITGSIAIENSTITHVGEVPKDFTPQREIEGRNLLALPGLVNAHTHSAMGIFRNLADDLSFGDWLFGKIIPAEAKLTEEDVYWGCLLGIAEMIKSGTTCFADMYLHMGSIARAVEEAGIRANLSFGPITSDVRGGGLVVDAQGCSAFIKEWNGAADGRIKTFMEIHSVYLFDKPSITDAALLAKELGVGTHIHLSESITELERSREMYGLTPIQAAHKMGVLDSNVLAAHCVQLDDEDIELLRVNGVNPVHCPSSNLKLGNGFAPAGRMLREGINLCLGTDGSASNNNLNMLEEMHLAALIHKGVSKDPLCVPASQVIDMATTNGALAAGFKDVGKIATGYKADIILIDTNKPHLCPVHDVKSAVVYAMQAADVDTVIINGQVVMQNRQLVGLDEELIMAKVREIAKRVC